MNEKLSVSATYMATYIAERRPSGAQTQVQIARSTIAWGGTNGRHLPADAGHSQGILPPAETLVVAGEPGYFPVSRYTRLIALTPSRFSHVRGKCASPCAGAPSVHVGNLRTPQGADAAVINGPSVCGHRCVR